MQNDAWGPWQAHDGAGCPIYGQPAQVQFRGGDIKRSERIGRVRSEEELNADGSAWVWGAYHRPSDIVRYRVPLADLVAVDKRQVEFSA